MIAARPAPIESALPAQGYAPKYAPEYAPGYAQPAGRGRVRPLNPSSHSASALPLWLRQLMLLQRGSTVAVVIMGGLTLLAYSWTVHSQRAWSQAYSQLSSLREDEPQLTRANEVLKEHLAQEAESLHSGLIEPSPAHMLYLEPAALRPAREVPPAPAPAQDDAPLGY